eukprot:9369891-Pyramimonas_sp.AAC.1
MEGEPGSAGGASCGLGTTAQGHAATAHGVGSAATFSRGRDLTPMPTEGSAGPALCLRGLMEGKANNVIIDDGGLFSGDLVGEGLDPQDLEEAKRRRQ